MIISAEKIKQLRELTSCGVNNCKKALEEAKGDIEKAKEILLKHGLELAAKKKDRVAKEGRIESYVHMGNKIGTIVEVNCETDFVARNEEFVMFVKDVAMHITAMAPKYVNKENIPADVLKQIKDEEGFVKEACLMNQAFVRDPSKTIQDLLNALIAKMGENIYISHFTRYKVGEIE